MRFKDIVEGVGTHKFPDRVVPHFLEKAQRISEFLLGFGQVSAFNMVESSNMQTKVQIRFTVLRFGVRTLRLGLFSAESIPEI